MEYKVSCHKDFATIKHTRNTIKLLQVIKQLIYSNGSKEIHTIQNQVMSTINLFRMRQGRGQTPQNFQEQFTVMRQVCDQLGLCIAQSEQGVMGNSQEGRHDKPYEREIGGCNKNSS